MAHKALQYRAHIAANGFIVKSDPDAADPALTDGVLYTNTIAETTAAAGVTVDGCLIKDGRVANLATAALYASIEQTGTGSEQNLAHGFGTVPSLVIAVPTAGHDGAGAAGTQMPTVAYGTHTTADIKVTVTAGAKFRVMAVR